MGLFDRVSPAGTLAVSLSLSAAELVGPAEPVEPVELAAWQMDSRY